MPRSQWSRTFGFLDHDASAAIGIGTGAAAALAWSGFAQGSYQRVMNSSWGALSHHLNSISTVHSFVTNGLMTIFFFAIGLELSRELRVGTLTKWSHSIPPIFAAIGGMSATALLSIVIGHASDTNALVHGWGVPMATDVAFSLGVLALAGKRLPPTLRVFLLTLAIADDALSAGVLSFTGHLILRVSGILCIVALVLFAIWLFTKSSRAVLSIALLIALWAAFAWANVDPPLAGVVAGLLTPFRNEWARNLERLASRFSIGIVLPVFAVVACGVRWSDVSIHGYTASIIVATVFIRIVGKVIGVTIGVLGARAIGARLSPSITWQLLVGIALLCAIGFTVPLLFAGALFGAQSASYGAFTLGLLIASLISAALGVSLLRAQARKA